MSLGSYEPFFIMAGGIVFGGALFGAGAAYACLADELRNKRLLFRGMALAITGIVVLFAGMLAPMEIWP